MVYRVAMAAAWLATIGLLCVYMEHARVRVGQRLYLDMKRVEDARGRVRRLELRYSRLASPAVLERSLREFLQKPPESSRPDA